MSAHDIPPDLDEAFRRSIPPFDAAGNLIDITRGEPPSTYEATIRLGLEDPRIHALTLGSRHKIVTPPMLLADLTARVVEEAGAKGTDKPVVASLAGGTEVERASDYLFDHRSFAYPHTTERPVAVLGAKYRWARADGLDPTAAGTAQPAAAQLSCTRPEHPPTDDGNNKGIRTSRPLEEVKR